MKAIQVLFADSSTAKRIAPTLWMWQLALRTRQSLLRKEARLGNMDLLVLSEQLAFTVKGTVSSLTLFDIPSQRL